jgi:hypothetical protein
VEFKNSETGAHTNTIEGLWRHAKLACPPFHRVSHHFLGYLATFMLRKKWKSHTNGFESFMKAAAQLFSKDVQFNNKTECSIDENELAAIVNFDGHISTSLEEDLIDDVDILDISNPYAADVDNNTLPVDLDMVNLYTLNKVYQLQVNSNKSFEVIRLKEYSLANSS